MVCLRALRILLVAAISLGNAAGGERNERIVLLPQLRAGDHFVYETHARIDRHLKTESNVATVLQPAQARLDLSNEVRLRVQDARLVEKKLLLAGEITLQPHSDVIATADTNNPPKPLTVSFGIGPDGGVTRAEGLDNLDPEQALSWQFWVAQFAFGWSLPPAGVRPGEKWKSQELEKTPSPIAGLVWDRETTYVQNDKCPVLAGEQCAVFLVSSTLRQKSNSKDATPEDYKIRQLKTSGTAKGTNETVVYVSLRTGLLLRATEDLQQSMVVTIAKADNSNQVHYDLQVTSHFDTEFVPPETGKPKSPPPKRESGAPAAAPTH